MYALTIALKNTRSRIIEAVSNEELNRDDLRALVLDEFGKLLAPPPSTPRASTHVFPTRKKKVQTRNYDGENEKVLLIRNYTQKSGAFFCKFEGNWSLFEQILDENKIRRKKNKKSQPFESYSIYKKDDNLENFITLLREYSAEYHLTFEILESKKDISTFYEKAKPPTAFSSLEYEMFEISRGDTT